ncbi:MAG: hypothetical protein AAB851_02560 [Patescibacteria group bacterium]|mgnify:CR=1 FL=1
MPKQLSKKDIKEVVVSALEPFAKAVQTDFAKVNKRLDKVDSRLDKVDFELNEVKNEVREMKENSSALFAKLDRFISLYEKHEQEFAIFGVQLRRLEERVMKLETKKL